MNEIPDRSESAVDRRTVILGAGAVGAAGVLAACSSSDSSDGVSTESPDTMASTEVPSSPTAIAKTDKVPVGGGLVVEDKMVVVTQPSDGDYKAFSSICPHQSCNVSEVTAEEIICPCHGSKFSSSTGEVLNGPATTGLAPVNVTVKGDEIVSEG